MGGDERASRHRDPVVEGRDGEVVHEVVVPVAVARQRGGRAHREDERVRGLVRRGLGLHAELDEGLADEGVVVEGEAVLDLEEHGAQVPK
jgi:hypothetical protein